MTKENKIPQENKKIIAQFFWFCWPYLLRHWKRFAMGVGLGFLYGMSNGLTLVGVSILLQRLTHPELVMAKVEAGKLAHQDDTSIGKYTFKSVSASVEQYVYFEIDPWLPLKDRPMDWKQSLGLFLLFPSIALLRGGLGYGSTYLLAWVGMRITNDVRSDSFRKMSSLSPEYFNKTTTAELLMRLESDTGTINTFLQLAMSDLIQQPFTLISLFLTMLYIDAHLTVLALIFVPLFAIPTRFVAKKIKNMGKADVQMLIVQSAVALESFNNIRVTKAYCLEEPHSLAYDKAGRKMSHYAMKMLQSREMLGPVQETLSGVGVSAIFVYVVSTGRSIDTLGTFLLAMILFFAPIKRLSVVSNYLIQIRIAAERILGLFHLQPTVPEPVNPVPFPPFQESIRFHKVGLRYRPQSDPVLDDISLEIRRGRRIGLAGESGGGKSSLLLLMLRFWDPTAGGIEIDGVDIRQFRIKDLRSQIAFVTQEVQLFNQTVADNIGFGRPNATREDIIEAAKHAHAHEFISALPQGYETNVGERGVLLSGGQRQRLAIARAFVRNAPILILDEATASLDSESESEVQRAIDDLSMNRTVICVAHRLSTLRNMDEIAVLARGGVIAERGTFDELIRRKGGIFARMAALQGIYPQDGNSSSERIAA